MLNVCLSLLGTPKIICSDTQQRILLPYIKLTLLISYLALETRAHTREFLADLFWPELDANNSRANLRRALFNIQLAFASAGLQNSLILADRNTVHLSKDCLWIDVLEFDTVAKTDFTTMTDSQLTLYRGPFMDGVLPGDEALANWVHRRRMRYEQKYIALLEQAIVQAADSKNCHATKGLCQQLISIDSVNELAHLYLIRMDLNCGNRISARKIYNTYCHTLHQELGMVPSQQLTAIVEAV